MHRLVFELCHFYTTIASSPTSGIDLADSEKWVSEYIKGLKVLDMGSFILQHHLFGLSSTFFPGVS